jgi:hypothetical protein
MVTATTTWTDEEIQQDVIDKPALDGRVQPNEIGVAVKGGVVTLTGWVDACTKKWAGGARRPGRVAGDGAVVGRAGGGRAGRLAGAGRHLGP